MKRNIEERACELASYIIEYRTTVRDAAKRFGISKSTVHTAGGKWNGQKRRRPPGTTAKLRTIFSAELY